MNEYWIDSYEEWEKVKVERNIDSVADQIKQLDYVPFPSLVVFVLGSFSKSFPCNGQRLCPNIAFGGLKG